MYGILPGQARDTYVFYSWEGIGDDEQSLVLDAITMALDDPQIRTALQVIALLDGRTTENSVHG